MFDESSLHDAMHHWYVLVGQFPGEMLSGDSHCGEALCSVFHISLCWRCIELCRMKCCTAVGTRWSLRTPVYLPNHVYTSTTAPVLYRNKIRPPHASFTSFISWRRRSDDYSGNASHALAGKTVTTLAPHLLLFADCSLDTCSSSTSTLSETVGTRLPSFSPEHRF